MDTNNRLFKEIVNSRKLSFKSIENKRIINEIFSYKEEKRNPIIQEYGLDKIYLTHHKENVLKFKDAGITLSEEGIPKNVYRWGGPYFYIVTIAHYGLELLSKYIARNDESYLIKAESVVEWLIKNQTKKGTWPVEYDHDWYPLRVQKLKSGWSSAMGQGLAISFLTRFAYLKELSQEDIVIKTAISALATYNVPSSEGGVQAFFQGNVFYEEYPTNPSSFVLNGFIYSILGPYDLFLYTEHRKSYSIYRAGINSLRQMLKYYDLGMATSYDLTHLTSGSYPPNIARHGYHYIHVQLLSALNLLENDFFSSYVERWCGYLYGYRSRTN